MGRKKNLSDFFGQIFRPGIENYKVLVESKKSRPKLPFVLAGDGVKRRPRGWLEQEKIPVIFRDRIEVERSPTS